MTRFVIALILGLSAVVGAVIVVMGDAEAGDLLEFGGRNSDGGPVYAKTNGSTVTYLEIADIDVQVPPCDNPEFEVSVGGFPINQDGEFSFIQGMVAIHGTISHEDGKTFINGTVDVGSPCVASVTFEAETESQLQGDFDCSLGKAESQADALPLGVPPKPPGTKEAITLRDVLALFKHIIYTPATPPPTSQSDCGNVGDQSPSGVIWGDMDCNGEVNAYDVLPQIDYVARITQHGPTEGSDCAPVGHYYPR